MIDADALIILTNVDGLFNGHPDDADSQLIPIVQPDDRHHLRAIAPSRSSFGRGGMHTKVRIAQKAAKVGIRTLIGNGKKPDVLLQIFNNNFPGTTFIPHPSVSNVKKWIAYSEQDKKGIVHINKGAVEALCSNRRISSLLPVGILKIEGQFNKGDIIQLVDEAQQNIGLGIAQYGDTTARQYIGQKGKKPLVHYDYLFIEKIQHA